MMDAAAQWRAGQITERNFMAGELAFVTATTNNRSVLVDFATWVMDSSGRGLILGQVDSSTRRRSRNRSTTPTRTTMARLAVAVAPASSVPGTRPILEQTRQQLRNLEAAYKFYQAGALPKPIPTRCGGTLFLNAKFGEPVRPGKCDSGLTWIVGEISGYRGWNTESGTTAPMNEYMLLPADGTALKRNGKTVLSETYVHMWEPNSTTAPWRRSGHADKSGAFLAPAEASHAPADFANRRK